MCLHVSVHNIMCVVQGPEVAVLDWYGPEADPVYSGEEGGGGGGGGGGGMAGLQVACKVHIQGGRVLGCPPEFFLEFRPFYTRFSLLAPIARA